MGITPFAGPPRTRPRSGATRRRAIGAALAVLGLAAIAAVLLVALPAGHRAGRQRAHRHAAARAAAAPALSPAGLPLASPAFVLGGLATPALDPVRLRLHSPLRAGILFNLRDGRVLWQRNALARLPIASLTKIMTALIAVESTPPRAHVLITPQALATNGSKVGELPRGRHVDMESLLYGLMLPSGNDAAIAIAQHVSPSVAAFVARMNERAAQLGLGCTRFSSPHGFYDTGNFSCAADLAVIAQVALAQPRIARIARTAAAVIPFPIKGGKLYLANNNPLLVYGYPGATGLKTGYTIAAGRCLLATADRHGVRLGVVLLNSTAPATEARALLDDAFARVYRQRRVPEPPIPSGA